MENQNNPDQEPKKYPETIEEKPKSKKIRFLMGALAFVLFVGAKFAVKFFYADGEAHLSKSEAWDSEFKTAFVQSCESNASENMAKEIGDAEKIKFLEKPISHYSNKYCECITGKVEMAHIVPTKYNATRGVASYQDEVASAINGYMESEQGGKDVEFCVSNAEESMFQNFPELKSKS